MTITVYKTNVNPWGSESKDKSCQCDHIPFDLKEIRNKEESRLVSNQKEKRHYDCIPINYHYAYIPIYLKGSEILSSES